MLDFGVGVMQLSGQYQIVNILHENNFTVVYRALRLSDSQSVIIKTLKSTIENERNVAQFVNEQRILSKIDSKHISQLLEVVALPSQYAHVFRDIGGSSLNDLIFAHPFSIEEGLYIALEIAKTIEYLHKNNVVHADINPMNVIYNPETKELQIIDFGYSFIDKNFLLSPKGDEISSGNLLYMSPEQTGLTKHKVDARSDFYSFGMTLYHLFLGSPPFDAMDRYELLHKQIALAPEPLHKIKKEIPYVLSEIIEKLISKKKKSRYQSDEALVHDLQRCLNDMSALGDVANFKIATRDKPILKLGRDLFGVDKEIALLRKAADDVFSSKAVNILVSGASGVGKTRLVEEFLTFFTASGTRILRGKFELYKSDAPYLAFKQLFTQLRILMMSQSTTASPCKIDKNSAQVLQEAFPELRDLFPLKKTKFIASMDNLKTQISYAVKELFDNVASAENPLIIHIDDLQWADNSSTELIKATILESSNPNLHFIGSYRDEETQANLNMSELIQALARDAKENTYFLELLPLQKSDLELLTGKLLSQEGKKASELGALIYKKTGGNPFYVKSLIDYLVDEGELRFEHGEWEYSLEQIQNVSASVNIIQIINAKCSLLDKAEKFYLQHLCVLGNRFSLDLTFGLMRSLKQSDDILERLVKKGFIEYFSNQYQFVHDQIQQRAFSSLNDETKRRVHHNIGLYFEKAYKNKTFNDVIFLVRHLNNAYLKENFPKKLFSLNVKALEKMVKSSSFSEAFELLGWIEKNIFCKSLWLQERTNAFKCKTLRVKVLYLNGYLLEANKEIELQIKQANTFDERLECFGLFKDICVTKGDGFRELLTFGNLLLEELGLKVPALGAEFHERVEKLKEKISLNPLSSKPAQIFNLPLLQNKNKSHIRSLLVDYWEGAFYLADISLMQWAYLTIMDDSLRHGNSSESAFGYVLFGSQLASQDEYKHGSQFAQLALKLNHKLRDANMLPKIHNFVANFINPYVRPLSSNVSLYNKSLQQSKVNGDLVFGTWANFLMHLSDYLSGTSLKELQANIDNESSFILGSGDEKMIAIFKVLTHTVSELRENTQKNEEESSALAMWETNQFYPALAWYAILKAQSCFLTGDFEKGLRYLNKYAINETNEVIMFPKIRLHFIRALTLLSKSSPLDEFESERLKNDVDAFKKFSKDSPRNFKFQSLLLEAEEMKRQETPWNAAKVYDEAVIQARKDGNPFFMALGSLCAGRFWKEFNHSELSLFYFSEAISGFNQWGAYEIANALKDELATSEPKKTIPAESYVGSSTIKNEPSNFQSLLKSFSAISQSKNIVELLNNLVKIILENATASKAVLVFEQDDKFYVRAKIDFVTGQNELLDFPLQECTLIPAKMLTYVINTKHNLTLEDPAQNGNFQFDPYFHGVKPASNVVIPTMVEGDVKALLYLENADVSTPLEPQTIKTLELILMQAAIVYKNTSLLETLIESENNLKRAQEISHVGSWTFNSKDGLIVWSEETYRIYELEPYSIPIDYQWFAEHLHPDDVEYVNKAVEKALAGERYYNVTHRILTSKGNEKIVHQRAQAYWENGNQMMSGTIQDITDFKRSETTISRLSQVVNQNPFSTIITNNVAEIEFINMQCVKMTGYHEREILGKKMNMFRSNVHPDSFYNDLWKTIKGDKKVWRGTIINRMKNGDLVDCESTIFPILDARNEIINFVTIQEDVTQRNVKDKLFLMQTRQAQMGEMLSMIAHQWRQPLSIINALVNQQRVGIMLETSSTEAILTNYDEIEFQVKHLSSTITDFRDFFKPDKKAVQTKSSVIISKALALLGNALKQKKIELKVEHLGATGYRTFEHELEQVIINLLKNALDAFEERGVNDGRIWIQSDETDDDAIITVEDNALGIDQKVMNTLFLPYVSTKDALQGTGLGLYMSKTIVEEHCHGSISVVNTNNGAKFTITIPLRQNNA